MSHPLASRRSFWIFAILTWLFAMDCGVLGVGLWVHAGAGAFIFMACLLTAACAFWLWLFRRYWLR